jgi:uncharacterized protein (DUF305 family)
MSKIEKALALTQQAMKMVEEELDRQNRDETTVGTKTQLEACKQQLCEMITQMEKAQLPPKHQRLFGMGHMIADSWPINSKLGEALLNAEHAYRNAP